jgi:CubicO group peptidase (beta-lactamase class C family)
MNCRLASFALATGCLLLGQSLKAQAPAKEWPRAKPASVGLDEKKIAEFDAELAGDKYGHMDSFLVIRCGKLVWERQYPRDYDKIFGGRTWLKQDMKSPYNYFAPDWHPYYHRGAAHTMQSVTKTVTSVVMGAAMARGEFHADVNTPLLKFFDPSKVANADERKRRISLRDVLTMTSGIDWNENLPYGDPNNSSDQMEATRDWIAFVINRPMASEPGTTFNYSGGDSELLAHIFEKETGKDIQDYAKVHVFRPLGIRDWYWKRTPLGLTDTESGLYLRPEDLAKIGFLYLHDGMWDGKRIVAREWVQASLAPAVKDTGDGHKYGFQWWLLPRADAPEKLVWLGSGWGGQRLMVVPELDLIVVHTAWNILDNRAPRGQEVLDRMLKAVVPGSACSAPQTK